MRIEIACRKWKPLTELENLKLENVLTFKEMGMLIPRAHCISIQNAFSSFFTDYVPETNCFLRVNVSGKIDTMINI